MKPSIIIHTIVLTGALLLTNICAVERITKYEDETVMERYDLNEDGNYHGYYEKYYRNNLIMLKGTYTEGRRCGTWIYYSDTGTVMQVFHYDDEGNFLSSVPGTEIDSGSGNVDASAGMLSERNPALGLAVVTDDPEVEIVIENRSYGKHEELFAELKPGEYIVEGRKEGCFSDIEVIPVGNQIVNTVSLHPRKIQIQVSPPTLFAVMGEERFQVGIMPISVGIKYKKNAFRAFYAFGKGSNGPPSDTLASHYHDKGYRIGGVSYTYAFFENHYLRFAGGASVSVSRISAQYENYDDWEYEEYEESFLNVGPRVAFWAGSEHIKFMIALNCLVKCDQEAEWFNKRNMVTLENGMVLSF